MSGAVDANYPRWAAFFDAERTDGNGRRQRVEWFVASPASKTHGDVLTALVGHARYIKRQRNSAVEKWTWKTTSKPSGEALSLALQAELQTFEDLGWEFKPVVVIPLDQDDYELMYKHGATVSTPYKALRHVESWTKKRGYEIK